MPWLLLIGHRYDKDDADVNKAFLTNRIVVGVGFNATSSERNCSNEAPEPDRQTLLRSNTCGRGCKMAAKLT